MIETHYLAARGSLAVGAWAVVGAAAVPTAFLVAAELAPTPGFLRVM